jgi:Na+(H+)/acetate symporter ActP
MERTRVHEERRAATLRLLEERDRSGDLEVWRETIGEYDHQPTALRSEAKELVSEVRGTASNDVDYVFPTYIISFIPTGLSGLLIAVIFAAAMSSLDSEITALSSSTVMDSYRRWFRPHATEGHYLLVSRLAALFWGGIEDFSPQS